MFTPGLELCGRFYRQAVRPLIEQGFPGLPHAAARLGPGSDVLGFDTPMSTDHDWGPSVQLFLREQDVHLAPQIVALLARELPRRFEGYPVDLVDLPDEPGTRVMRPRDSGPVEHRVTPLTLRGFVAGLLGWDPDAPLAAADWLTFPAQRLRELTAGAVYRDDTGELAALRARLAWYPHDVWLYLMAAGWQRIAQEEHLMPRAGFVGDELGSALIGARLARDVMALAFLIERRYAPYPKWFGTAFARLECAPALAPALLRAQRAAAWQEREAALCAAYERLAAMHNALGLTAPLPPEVSAFHSRPFRVLHAERFAQALCAAIGDPEVRRIAGRRPIGGIDQLSDSTDLRADPSWRPALRALYEPEG